jgi:hypothetical protein
MPIYGDQLAFFPELMEEYTIFKMDALTGGGYGKRYDFREVTGYWSWIKGGNLGTEGDLMTENQNATLWVKDESDGKGIIRQGEFLEREGEIFRFIHDDGFSREGGFIVYNLQLVPAFTDRQHRDRGVDLGASDFN